MNPVQTTRAPSSMSADSDLPWWRHPMVWLVIAGPVAVVLAGIWTFWIAASQPDPIVGDTARPGATGTSQAHQPAQQARNHAATAR